MARGSRDRHIFAALAGTAFLAQPVAAQTIVPSDTAVSHEGALQCLTLAIAYEAGFEPLEGKQAVAEVIINRAHHPAYPKSICGVVFQGSSRRTGCQFTFTCDGSLNRILSERVMLGARVVASSVLAGEATRQVGGATHYHANYVSPYWAPSLIRVGRIGAHIFYRAPGSPDLAQRYTITSDPLIAALGPWLKAGDPLTQREAARVPAEPSNPALPEAPFTPWGLTIR